MKADCFKALLVVAPILIGAAVTPASAVPATWSPLELLKSTKSTSVQPVHCLRVRHTHRRCTLWRNGVCRRWVKYTHRCG